MKPQFDPKRPLSWSALSSFEYDNEQWYRKYLLKETPAPTKEMMWGKKFADSCEAGTPLAPVTILKHVEYPLSVVFNGIPLVGYIDSYEPHTKLREYKTGKKPWDQKRADAHRQIDMYLLMLYITYKVWPENIDCCIEWIPTKENGDFSISFTDPVVVHQFHTKRNMEDILKMGQWIKETRLAMIKYCEEHG